MNEIERALRRVDKLLEYIKGKRFDDEWEEFCLLVQNWTKTRKGEKTLKVGPCTIVWNFVCATLYAGAGEAVIASFHKLDEWGINSEILGIDWERLTEESFNYVLAEAEKVHIALSI